jgi:hypothetical protein
MDHRQHDSSCFSEVRLSGMPESEVSDHERAFLDDWLRWRTLVCALFQQVNLDPSTCSLSVLTLLGSERGEVVSAKPNFRAAVFWSHLHERYIDNQCKGTVRVFEVGVGVHRLVSAVSSEHISHETGREHG